MLITLLVVMLAGVALGALARRSVSDAVAARTAVESLQRRWAVASARSALLGQVEEVLASAEAGLDLSVYRAKMAAGEVVVYQHAPAAELRVVCELADMPFELVLTDEQARLNVNDVLARSDLASLQAQVRRLAEEGVGGGVLRSMPVLLRPQSTKLPGGRERMTFGSYGQVFASPDPAVLVGGEVGRGAASRLTCWGDGRVNVRRASDAVLRAAVGRSADPQAVSDLLEVRRESPFLGLAAMLGRVDRLNADERRAVTLRLTDASTCHGLWVVARGPQRSWFAFATGNGALSIQAREQGQGPVVGPRDEFNW